MSDPAVYLYAKMLERVYDDTKWFGDHSYVPNFQRIDDLFNDLLINVPSSAPPNDVLRAVNFLGENGVFEVFWDSKAGHRARYISENISKLYKKECKINGALYVAVNSSIDYFDSAFSKFYKDFDYVGSAYTTSDNYSDGYMKKFKMDDVAKSMKGLLNTSVNVRNFATHNNFTQKKDNLERATKTKSPNPLEQPVDWTKSGAIAAWIAVGLTVFGWLIFGGR
ncbi:MAG: hypothetical protein AABY88_06060 [Pseudomonadota bacterium]